MLWLWILVGFLLIFMLVVFRGAPYVPSRKSDIKQAFKDIYELGENDLLVDIGSGDGVVLRIASGLGAKALGYELNPVLVLVSKLLSINDSRVHVRWRDFWFTEFPEETTIVYTFGESHHIKKMAKKVKSEASRLGKRIYFLSYGFEVPGEKCRKKSGPYFLYEFGPLL